MALRKSWSWRSLQPTTLHGRVRSIGAEIPTLALFLPGRKTSADGDGPRTSSGKQPGPGCQQLPPVCPAISPAERSRIVGASIAPAIRPGIVGTAIAPVWPVECPSISVIAWTVSVRVAIVGGVVAVGGVAVGWIPISIAIVGRCCGCANQPARDKASRHGATTPSTTTPAVAAPAVAAPAVAAPAAAAPPAAPAVAAPLDLFGEDGTRDGVCGSHRDLHRLCLADARARERCAEGGGGEKPFRDHAHDRLLRWPERRAMFR